jgi:hypothetical protein
MNHAIATDPNSAIKASSEPAAIVHTADRLVAHHMNQDATRAEPPAATTTRIAISICSLGARGARYAPTGGRIVSPSPSAEKMGHGLFTADRVSVVPNHDRRAGYSEAAE